MKDAAYFEAILMTFKCKVSGECYQGYAASIELFVKVFAGIFWIIGLGLNNK